MAKGTVLQDQMAGLCQHMCFMVWCILTDHRCVLLLRAFKRKGRAGALHWASEACVLPRLRYTVRPQAPTVHLPGPVFPHLLKERMDDIVSEVLRFCEWYQILPLLHSEIYDRLFFSYFFSVCEPGVILIM